MVKRLDILQSEVLLVMSPHKGLDPQRSKCSMKEYKND